MIPQLLFLNSVSPDAKFGLFGVLSGTVLGALLTWITNAFNKHGKVIFFTKSYSDSFSKPDLFGGFEDSTSLDDTNYFHFNLVLEVFNKSHDIKLIRDIQVVFCDKDKVVFSFVPKDDSTKSQTGPNRFYEDVKAFSLDPKEIITLHLHEGFGPNNNINQFSKVNNIKLVYRNDNDHLKKHIIIKNYELPFEKK